MSGRGQNGVGTCEMCCVPHTRTTKRVKNTTEVVFFRHLQTKHGVKHGVTKRTYAPNSRSDASMYGPRLQIASDIFRNGREY